MGERVCYLTIKVRYRTDGTNEDSNNTIGENCNYNISMPSGYGIEITDTELLEVE